MVLHPEGRAVWNSSTSKWEYEYDVKDHLGNTRASFAINDKVKVLQTRDYYPFGMEQASWYLNDANASKFRYNGKELQDEEVAGSSLGWYDYGARFYDPQLARWHTVDALAEWDFALSPYNYVTNNPMRYIDPDGNFKTKFGAWIWKILNGGGQTLKDQQSGEYFVSQEKTNTENGEVNVIAKRIFQGNNISSNRSNVQVLEGGYSVTGNGGWSIGKGYRAKHNYGTLDYSARFEISYFLHRAWDYFQSDGNSHENKLKPTNDLEIQEKHSGLNRNRIDGFGRIYTPKVDKRRNVIINHDYEGNPVDTIQGEYVNSYGDTVKWDWHYPHELDSTGVAPMIRPLQK